MKEILGTCVSVGCTVDHEEPRDLQSKVIAAPPPPPPPVLPTPLLRCPPTRPPVATMCSSRCALRCCCSSVRRRVRRPRCITCSFCCNCLQNCWERSTALLEVGDLVYPGRACCHWCVRARTHACLLSKLPAHPLGRRWGSSTVAGGATFLL